MSEQREQLVETVAIEIAELADQFYQLAKYGKTPTYTDMSVARRVIALVEADVARRLLSEDAMNAAADVVSNFHDYIGETGYFASISISERYRTQAALRHIGIEPGRAGHPACRVCGCTDNQACEGGCWWVEPDLCSACAEGDSDAN